MNCDYLHPNETRKVTKIVHPLYQRFNTGLKKIDSHSIELIITVIYFFYIFSSPFTLIFKYILCLVFIKLI